MSVSYTHLFVTSDMVEKDGMNEEKLTAYYNDLLRLKEMGNVTDKIVGESDYSMNQTVDIFPVSYTHLDVYKRQAVSRKLYSTVIRMRIISESIQSIFLKWNRSWQNLIL